MRKGLPAFPVNVAVLPRAGFPVQLSASESERQAIAAHCGVNRIDRLAADLTFGRWRRDGVEVRGRLRASLEQDCVVTLEPLMQEIDEPVALRFLPEQSKLSRDLAEPAGELLLDPEGEDLPETFPGDTIDAWAVAIECLVLAIDPFPRAADAEIEERFREGKTEESGPDSPFSALKGLDFPGKGRPGKA